jgi:hypothetical protein
LIFEEKQQRTGFIGDDQREAKIIQKILDKISIKQKGLRNISVGR